MRSTAPQSTGMHIAIPSSEAGGAAIGRVAHPTSPSCREPHDLPDVPLSNSGMSPSPAALSLYATTALDYFLRCPRVEQGICGQRNGLKNSRTSRARASGCSMAAKCPPLSITLQR